MGLFFLFHKRSAKVDSTSNTKKGDRSLPKINYFCVAMYKQLTSEQRYAIKLGLQAKMTLTTIAQQICVSVSTVSREIKRNKNRNGGYLWKLAHEMVLERREIVVHNRLTPRPILFNEPSKSSLKRIGRPSRYQVIWHLKAFLFLTRPYKKHVLTITTDNGSEFAKHE